MAQLDRAFGYGPEGRGFESLRARQAKTDRIAVRFCLAYFRPEGSNPERADAVKKKPTAWLFQADAAEESACASAENPSGRLLSIRTPPAAPNTYGLSFFLKERLFFYPFLLKKTSIFIDFFNIPSYRLPYHLREQTEVYDHIAEVNRELRSLRSELTIIRNLRRDIPHIANELNVGLARNNAKEPRERNNTEQQR